MRLDNLVIGAGDIIAHGFAGVLGVDAVNNAIHGNYQMAVAEAIMSTGIEVSKYFDRQKRKVVADFVARVPEYILRMNRLNQQIVGYQR